MKKGKTEVKSLKKRFKKREEAKKKINKNIETKKIEV